MYELLNIQKTCFNEKYICAFYVCINLSIKYNYKQCSIYSLESIES